MTASGVIVSPAIARWRIALLVAGVAILVFSVTQLIAEVPPTRYLGIAAWLLGALIIHDGIIAFLVLGASILARRLRAPIPFAAFVIVQGAVVVAGIVTIIVVPAAIKKAVGTANPSILPLDYLANLGIFYLGVAVVTAVVLGVYFAVRMRRGRQTRTR